MSKVTYFIMCCCWSAPFNCTYEPRRKLFVERNKRTWIELAKTQNPAVVLNLESTVFGGRISEWTYHDFIYSFPEGNTSDSVQFFCYFNYTANMNNFLYQHDAHAASCLNCMNVCCIPSAFRWSVPNIGLVPCSQQVESITSSHSCFNIYERKPSTASDGTMYRSGLNEPFYYCTQLLSNSKDFIEVSWSKLTVQKLPLRYRFCKLTSEIHFQSSKAKRFVCTYEWPSVI